MKVEKKESGSCTIAISVKLEAEEIKAGYNKVLNLFVRNGQLPGFRRGKAPVNIIKQKFHSEIQSEAQQELFRQFYPKALEESGVKSINLANVTDLLLDPATGFSFTALVEVRPEFDLPKYKKLAIKAGDLAVTEEQVTERLEGFRRAFAKYEDAKEGDTIADGDFVEIDYKGAYKDQPLAELVPDQKAVCGAEGFWLQLEEGRFLPELLEALKGMKAGETKNGVKVKFPKDAAPEPIKGKTCTYDLTVKSFRRRVLPDDAAFVEAAKAESLDAMRKNFREMLEKEAKDRDLEERRNQAIELLLKKADFDVPPSLVRRQTQSSLEELAQRAQYAGLTADYIEQNREQILGEAENNATRQVRLSYILAGIAEAEKFEISDDDVTKGLERIAASSRGKTTVEDLRKQLTENDQIDGYKEQLKAERALDFVLAEAK